jgi:predicted transcriptional regulator
MAALKDYPGRRFSMPDPEEKSSIRERGEEAVGELAQALLENPVFNSALSRALGAGERAVSAQRAAIGALNVASGSDVERLEQRLRSLSGRLEELEDRIDELSDQLADVGRRLRASEGADARPG